MKYYAFLIDEKLIGVGQARMLNEDVQNVEIAQSLFDEYREDKDKYTYLNGEFVLNPEYEKKLEKQALEQAKAERAEAVERITVEVDGMKFDGDEESQTRMGRTIAAAIALGVDIQTYTQVWVLADNTVAQITIAQLAQALKLSGEAQTALWTKPYEGDNNE